MNKLLLAICTALALAADTTEDQAVAACASIKPKLDELGKLRTALGIDDRGTSDASLAACTALKTKADAATVDPAKYVPVAVVTELKDQVAALTAKQNSVDVTALVDAGLKDGRILPAMKEWATALGKKDIAELTAYLDKAQPIAALAGSQTQGVPPKTDANPNQLTEQELAVCTATGISPENFSKAKAA